jgi:tetrahydromethanopterin S-methyltransferase subunit F
MGLISVAIRTDPSVISCDYRIDDAVTGRWRWLVFGTRVPLGIGLVAGVVGVVLIMGALQGWR